MSDKFSREHFFSETQKCTLQKFLDLAPFAPSLTSTLPKRGFFPPALLTEFLQTQTTVCNIHAGMEML